MSLNYAQLTTHSNPMFVASVLSLAAFHAVGVVIRHADRKIAERKNALRGIRARSVPVGLENHINPDNTLNTDVMKMKAICFDLGIFNPKTNITSWEDLVIQMSYPKLPDISADAIKAEAIARGQPEEVIKNHLMKAYESRFAHANELAKERITEINGFTESKFDNNWTMIAERLNRDGEWVGTELKDLADDTLKKMSVAIWKNSGNFIFNANDIITIKSEYQEILSGKIPPKNLTDKDEDSDIDINGEELIARLASGMNSENQDVDDPLDILISHEEEQQRAA